MIIENSHAGEWDYDMLRAEFDDYLELSEFNLMLEETAREIEEAVGAKADEPELPIVPKMSEKYTAVVVICRNEIDENHVAEKLGLERNQCYKSNAVGMSRVVDAKVLIESWK